MSTELGLSQMFWALVDGVNNDAIEAGDIEVARQGRPLPGVIEQLLRAREESSDRRLTLAVLQNIRKMLGN